MAVSSFYHEDGRADLLLVVVEFVGDCLVGQAAIGLIFVEVEVAALE